MWNLNFSNTLKLIWFSSSFSATLIITFAVICFTFKVPKIILVEHNVYIALTESLLGLFTVGYSIYMMYKFITQNSRNSPGIQSSNT